MSHRSIRRLTVVAAAMLVPMAAACAPQATGHPSPSGPVVTTTSVAFDRLSYSAEYCITAGNSAGTITVSLDAANTTITGAIVDVSIDQGRASHLAVQHAMTSDVFASGSCHEVSLIALISPMTILIADFTITH